MEVTFKFTFANFPVLCPKKGTWFLDGLGHGHMTRSSSDWSSKTVDNQKLGKYIISLGCPIAHLFSFSGVHVIEINQLLRKKKSILEKLLLLRFTRPGASASRYFCYCLTFLSSAKWLGFWILFQEGERLPKTCHWIIETEFRLNSLFHYSSIHMINLVPSWNNKRELGTPKHISGAFATSTETAQLSWDTGIKRGCGDSWH